MPLLISRAQRRLVANQKCRLCLLQLHGTVEGIQQQLKLPPLMYVQPSPLTTIPQIIQNHAYRRTPQRDYRRDHQID
jgi:hypothetical protein